MNYQIIRQNRKSISLSFDKDKQLLVKAPYSMLESDIYKFIESKTKWISTKQEQLNKTPTYQKIDWHNLTNSYIYIFGQQMQIKFDNQFALVNNYLLIPKNANNDSLKRFLQELLLDYYHKRANFFANKMQVKFNSLNLSTGRKRLGYCTFDNHIYVSWRMIFCDKAIIDYLIIHELAHIKHKHHLASFWDFVGKFCNYKQAKQWLQANLRIFHIL